VTATVRMPAETIVAPATPRGTSALAVLRLSGPLVPALLSPTLGKDFSKTPRYQHLANYSDLSGTPLDQVLASYFEEGKSYTGEAMLELSCHGNPLIVDLILQDLCARGCRLAEPGEFTRRAFLNGKLLLPQAEAVQDVIASRSRRALEIAQAHLAGNSGRRLLALYERMLSLLAEMEAYLDFPEEDLPPENHAATKERYLEVKHECETLAAPPRSRELLFDGIRIVILGAPNAGKSSLLNALLGEDRALVSDIAGTTRDFIREEFIWHDYRIQILDTAGLRLSASSLEAEGIKRSLELVRSADAILLLVARDGTPPENLTPEDLPLSDKNLLVVETKTDLPLPSPALGAWSSFPQVGLSLKTSDGWKNFEDAFDALLGNVIPPSEENQLILNQRQNECLRTCLVHLDSALPAFLDGMPEIAATDLRQALEAFAGIIGAFDHERMLDHLFGSFCIGK
jgi:tRNA modification GTPase